MAPEQVRGKVSAATDVFALGHLALFAATGHTAFGEGNADVLFYRLLHEPPDLDGCPGELRDLIANCLAKNPDDRPSCRGGHRLRRRRPAGPDDAPGRPVLAPAARRAEPG